MKAKHQNHWKALAGIFVGACILAVFFWGNLPKTMVPSKDAEIDRSGASKGSISVASSSDLAASAHSTQQAPRSPARPLPPALMPFALSPGRMSLGDAIQDVLARSDGAQALKLGRIFTECVTLGAREMGIELERTHPTGDAEFDARRLKALSDQLVRIKSECQTVPGDPKNVLTQLVELAYSQQVPGSAQNLLSLRPDQASKEQLERLALDARAGEWLSVMSASVGEQVPVSKGERLEMLLALQQTYEQTQPFGSDFDLMYRRVVDKVWSTSASGGPGASTAPSGQALQRPSSTTLPPEVVMPTDPKALARIAQLTAQLTRQVKEMEEERMAARRRATGG